MYQLSLERIGLSKNEAKCYLALIERGSSSANEISRLSGVHRVAVYDALRGLREKGFISQITKANKMLFEAASPTKVTEVVAEQKKELDSVEQMIPQLLLQYRSGGAKQEVYSFKGIAGLRTVFDDMLTAKGELLDFGAEWRIKDVLSTYYPHWDNERVARKITMRIIASERIRRHNPEKLRLTKLRYVPQEVVSRVSTYIYNEKTVMVMWVQPVLAVVVHHADVATAYRNYFEYLWSKAKK